MEQIKDIIPQVINHIAQKKPEVQNKIQRLWQGISNGKAAKHTSVVNLQKGTLTVHVDSPAWLFQMNLQKRKILEHLKEEIPELTQIYFKIGKVG